MLLGYLRGGLRERVCLLGGIDSLPIMEDALARGFACVAVARALLREPGLLGRLQKDSEPAPSACTHCNLCIVGSAMAEQPLRCAEESARIAW